MVAEAPSAIHEAAPKTGSKYFHIFISESSGSVLLGGHHGQALGLGRDARQVELEVATTIFAGVLGGLLIIDFVLDNSPEVGPVDGLGDAAPVDEQCRGA